MKNKDEMLEKIAQHLMLYNSFADTIGLLDGKMGGVIFFFLYAKYSEKTIYEKFAYELLSEIYEDISRDTPIGFKDGLSGIAWGMDYLIYNKYVVTDDEDLLDELDELIIKAEVNKIQGASLETGLKGFAHYVISRKNNALLNHSIISIDYVRSLKKALEKVNKDEETFFLSQQLSLVIEEIRPQYDHNHLFKKIVGNVLYDPDQIFYPQRTFGLVNNGYIGIGLHLLLKN